MADLDVAPTRHISASEARAAGPSSTDASTSDSEESRGEVGRKELRKRGDLSRSRKRSRSQSRDSGSSSSQEDSQKARQRSKSRHKKKKKEEKKSKKKKHKKHKHKSKDRDEASGPVQLSKFLQEEKSGKEGRYSSVSGQKIKLKIDKSQADIDAARRRSELLAALNGFYD